ncbi:MAG: hypothetical protein WBF53_12380 [Litorimonas sp.]
MRIFSTALATTLSLLFQIGTAGATEIGTPPDDPAGFSNFVGTWTLKQDRFQMVWDGETVETLTIPNHITICRTVTTASSVSCTVDDGNLQGQIFWVADDHRRTLQHLSHFGERRMGVGTGTIDGQGNLKNRIVFSDEPEGTYRIYEYSWVTPDEYEMMSRQYDSDGQRTGNFYAGSFVRIGD